MRMEITIGLYGKGNEIIFYRSSYVRLCLVLNDNYCCMCCCHRNTLHQICTSWISNDNVHQGLKTIFRDDNIHLFLCMAKEKVGTSFCMWAAFSNMIVATVSWSVSWIKMHHSHMGSIANGYPNHGWYGHIDIIKYVQP